MILPPKCRKIQLWDVWVWEARRLDPSFQVQSQLSVRTSNNSLSPAELYTTSREQLISMCGDHYQKGNTTLISGWPIYNVAVFLLLTLPQPLYLSEALSLLKWNESAGTQLSSILWVSSALTGFLSTEAVYCHVTEWPYSRKSLWLYQFSSQGKILLIQTV